MCAKAEGESCGGAYYRAPCARGLYCKKIDCDPEKKIYFMGYNQHNCELIWYYRGG